MSRAGLCQALEVQEALPGERTLDKAFASLGRLEWVQTQWGKRGERLYRVGLTLKWDKLGLSICLRPKGQEQRRMRTTERL